MDDAVIDYLKQHYSLSVGNQTAEQIKIEIRQRRAARPGVDR